MKRARLSYLYVLPSAPAQLINGRINRVPLNLIRGINVLSSYHTIVSLFLFHFLYEVLMENGAILIIRFIHIVNNIGNSILFFEKGDAFKIIQESIGSL